MKYCFSCGAQLPISGVNFCPYCGTNLKLSESQPEVSSSPEINLEGSPEKSDARENKIPQLPAYLNVYASIRSLKWRDWSSVFKIFLIITIGMMAIGTSINLTKQDSSNIISDWNKQLPVPSVLVILENNLGIAYAMMIPFAGIPFGAYTLYNTGLIISAQAVSASISRLLAFLSLFILPFSWLEFFAYAAAMTQGIFLIIGFVKHRLISEVIRSGLIAVLVFVLLLMGAVIEMLFI